MITTRTLTALALAALSLGATAQTVEGAAQRDVRQETRILDGLRDGSLSTTEAARLQREQARVDRLQARSLRDGTYTPAEAARVKAAQDAASQDIQAARHNAVTGDPQSASSRRMQHEVARDVRQETRIADGIAQGQLGNREVAALERGQARTGARQAHVAADGKVTAAEAHRVERAQDRQSRRIHRLRHNDVPARG